jgi:predicted phage replisome organizer
MSEISWIKLKTDMFSDDKIEFIEGLPEGDSIIVIWIKLLSLAGKCNAGGFIMLSENIPYTEEMLVSKFKKPHMVVKLALQTLSQLQMIDKLDEGFFISNWEKHQNIEKMDSIREYNRLKQQKYRDKKRYLLTTQENVDNDVDNNVEDSYQVVTSIDIKNKNKKKNNTHAELFDQFWTTYPRKLNKQDALKVFNSLINQGESFDTIMNCTNNYIKELEANRTEERFIKHATTFLRSNRYLDYLKLDDNKNKLDGRPSRELPTVEITREEFDRFDEIYKKRGINKDQS